MGGGWFFILLFGCLLFGLVFRLDYEMGKSGQERHEL